MWIIPHKKEISELANKSNRKISLSVKAENFKNFN